MEKEEDGQFKWEEWEWESSCTDIGASNLFLECGVPGFEGSQGVDEFGSARNAFEPRRSDEPVQGEQVSLEEWIHKGTWTSTLCSISISRRLALQCRRVCRSLWFVVRFLSFWSALSPGFVYCGVSTGNTIGFLAAIFSITVDAICCGEQCSPFLSGPIEKACYMVKSMRLIPKNKVGQACERVGLPWLPRF